MNEVAFVCGIDGCKGVGIKWLPELMRELELVKSYLDQALDTIKSDQYNDAAVVLGLLQSSAKQASYYVSWIKSDLENKDG